MRTNSSKVESVSEKAKHEAVYLVNLLAPPVEDFLQALDDVGTRTRDLRVFLRSSGVIEVVTGVEVVELKPVGHIVACSRQSANKFLDGFNEIVDLNIEHDKLTHFDRLWFVA